MRKRLGTIEELRMIERWFGIDDLDELRSRYDAAIEALQDDDVGAWLANAAPAGVSDGAARDFREHWLESSMVSDVPAGVMRNTFKAEFGAALTEARENDLKTSIAVMIGDGFDVDYCVGANAVTVIVTIPSTAVPPSRAQ